MRFQAATMRRSFRAVQFDPDKLERSEVSEFVRAGKCYCMELAQDGRYCQIHRAGGRPYYVLAFDGRDEIAAGDWLVVDSIGRVRVLRPECFAEEFLCSDESRGPDCCKGSGVIDTGNNDLPCDCPHGDNAVFNSENGPILGRDLRKKLSG